MPRPLIGISTYVEESTRYGVWDLPTSLVPSGYYELVQAAGGAAVLLPPDEPGRAAEVLGRVDGLVVAGGPDLDPVHYGAARDPRTGAPATVRDRWELALLDAALAAGLPLLGICRGMQALNVALGGTLVQHIDGHVGAPGVMSRHPVRPVPGTRYAAAVPEEAQVPTYHHQAVDRLGRGLVISADAVDGTVEAIELSGPEHWVMGVQWHPERDRDTRVTAALVEAAAARAARRTPDRVPVA
ncbi:gamma-glutamyl-gamma-aminobutyrate hydrolase family protein [Streptomyces antarcticus]|uniref:gamma-glutamyl-gamma-aminobutyrate hydrolase family protein n=1 Tax=Streptomyces antarcticus TaxID=2996458 RepID=UPI00226E06B3|nr:MULTISPECIES: gamma-glutamyl-gamma-aminobutyrate hydrolase family protein [unclassified Streptomyces]MCY0945156.1 gamma-glutamyl-gamma-aminobutyrate hydrolase family protein [Streptomyces sp. H34-AA3]MCZ4086779.1 gamma-glutamyl-gamma-aminobutyrate hydrolase family protein [Streptomyces sp. H34-S5]